MESPVRGPLFASGLRRLAQDAGARACDLLVSTRGVAAVEFAMVLPVMLLMYLGMAEVTLGVNIDRKITLLSRSLADLTGRASTVSSTDLNNIFTAASAVVAPYPTAGAQMRISTVTVTGTGSQVQGKVCWSEGRGGLAGLATGANYPLPAGYQTSGMAFVVAEVKMPYQPTFGSNIISSITLSQTTPWPIRNVSEVVYSGFKTFKDNELGRSATGKCLA
ncbi:MAG TPA: TadE/TadG family type IV pilus assembly protein [Beijerinckiaceae bacterium]|nr:TadE/TadG family type IV pilus assembly protein [Beijerinckiaceae bacterium]